MKLPLRIKVPICMLALIPLAVTASAKETEIPLEQVPEIVIKTAKTEVPGIKILEAETEMENGKVVYELEGEKGEYHYELEISKAGKLLELTKEKKEN